MILGMILTNYSKGFRNRKKPIRSVGRANKLNKPRKRGGKANRVGEAGFETEL